MREAVGATLTLTAIALFAMWFFMLRSERQRLGKWGVLPMTMIRALGWKQAAHGLMSAVLAFLVLGESGPIGWYALPIAAFEFATVIAFWLRWAEAEQTARAAQREEKHP